MIGRLLFQNERGTQSLKETYLKNFNSAKMNIIMLFYFLFFKLFAHLS